MSAENQAAVDGRLIELDGTPDKSRLGANATLGVSCAVARAAAAAGSIPLWRRLAGGRKATIPLPMINILSGGLHAGGNFEFQDFLAVPHGFSNYAESLEAVVAIHRATRTLIESEGIGSGTGRAFNPAIGAGSSKARSEAGTSSQSK